MEDITITGQGSMILFGGGSGTNVSSGNSADKIDYFVNLEPINLVGPKREPVSGVWGNVDYYLLGGIAPSPGMMKADPKDVLKIVNSIKNFLSATKTAGTVITKNSVIQGFQLP